MGETAVFTGAGVLRGARASGPIVIATIPFGLVAGIAAQGQGLSLTDAVLMSVIVFAGSAQLLVLAAWTHPAPILAASFAAFVVNLRLALMGPVLAPWLDRLRGWRLWGSLFFLTDQNWALSVTDMRSGGRDAAFLMGSGLTLWVVWVSGTALGHLVGATLHPSPGHPLFFAALAVFVAMLVGMWRGYGDAMPWMVAALVAVGVAWLLPGTSWHIIAGALAGSLAGALRDRYRDGPDVAVDQSIPGDRA
ncbi:MAG TPA: AzlC family ABC transporter permease [Stellaceae bacterium]|nr:AzlC family ABC transporter permease [Stellaceae bacterium]